MPISKTPMQLQSEDQRDELIASIANTAPIVPVEESTTILAVLSDEDACSILCAADEPLTAKELTEECGIPLSTVYRKLDRLANTPLMEETTRAQVLGKHPEQYQRRFETLQIHAPSRCSAGMNISLVPRATKES